MVPIILLKQLEILFIRAKAYVPILLGLLLAFGKLISHDCSPANIDAELINTRLMCIRCFTNGKCVLDPAADLGIPSCCWTAFRVHLVMYVDFLF